MNKKINTQQMKDSFDDDELSELEYLVPKSIKALPENFNFNSNILNELGLDLNSNFKLEQSSLDFGKTVILPKDNVDQNVLDFENFRTTIACLYVIYNTIHDKYYIGQTTNFARRLFDHIRTLDRQTHNNKDLQMDFNDIKNRGLEPYKSFKVYTNQSTKIMRTFSLEESYTLDFEFRRIEASLIKAYRDAGCKLYNSTGFTKGKSKRQLKKQEPEDFWSLTREIKERGLINCSLSPSSSVVSVLIDGVEYPNINEAAAQLNVNRKNLFYCILSKRFPTYTTLEQAKTGDLYVYFKKERRVKFTNTLTGEIKVFPNASQCNMYLQKLKGEVDSDTQAKYKAAGIFVDKKTIYAKLEKGNNPVFSYFSDDDMPEKVLVI